MKRFLQIVANILSITAPVATFTGILVVPKYIASFPIGSFMFWLGLALAASAVAATYVSLFGWSVVDRIYSHYATITYHEVFRRGQLPSLRGSKWSIALGFCATVVSFFCDAAMPVLFYAIALPSCAVSLVCLVPTGVAYLWMRRIAHSYDGYISYTYEIFNMQTGTREPRQDVCHIREVDSRITTACIDFLENQRKYGQIRDELILEALVRAFCKTTSASSESQNDDH